MQNVVKKTIRYSNLDGEKVSEDFYFRMRKSDLLELEMASGGTFISDLQRIAKMSEEGGEKPDGQKIIDVMHTLISRSVGYRSDDGKDLLHSPEFGKRFLGTEAYSELFLELVTDAEQAGEFAKGIMPSPDEIAEIAARFKAAEEKLAAQGSGEDMPVWYKEGRKPTDKELQGAPREHLLLAMRMSSPAGQDKPSE